MEDVRQARQALTDAINAHDLEAIKRYVHPDYQSTSDLGVTLDYQAMMGAAEQVVKTPGFHETVEIESAEVEGDRAELKTRRTDSFTGFLWWKQRTVTEQMESWRNVDGCWMIAGEHQL